MHSVLYKKQNVTGYIQYYKKMVGQTQRPWVRQNPSSCLTFGQTEKKVFANSATLKVQISFKYVIKACWQQMSKKCWMVNLLKESPELLIIDMYVYSYLVLLYLKSFFSVPFSTWTCSNFCVTHTSFLHLSPFSHSLIQ